MQQVPARCARIRAVIRAHRAETALRESAPGAKKIAPGAKKITPGANLRAEIRASAEKSGTSSRRQFTEPRGADPRRAIWYGQFRVGVYILGLFRLVNSFDGSFFWSMSLEMWPDVNLKHFRHQKNILFWCLKRFKSYSGHISNDIDQKNDPSNEFPSLKRPQMAKFSL